MFFVLPFPSIDPVAFSLGAVSIRWYGLAYVLGAILALAYIKVINRKTAVVAQKIYKSFFDDLLFYSILGVILGGRIGYVVFYGYQYYMYRPWEIFYVWQGGMSFHGGFLGVILSIIFLARKYNIHPLVLLDLIAPSVPIGLFFGRVANFINAELYGRITNVPWGVIFPNDVYIRHPSQLYEAFLEGIVLFFILLVAWWHQISQYRGMISGIFALGYGIFRIFIEFFREPEIIFLGYITIGQLLSFPIVILGFWLIIKAYAQRKTY